MADTVRDRHPCLGILRLSMCPEWTRKELAGSTGLEPYFVCFSKLLMA